MTRWIEIRYIELTDLFRNRLNRFFFKTDIIGLIDYRFETDDQHWSGGL